MPVPTPKPLFVQRVYATTSTVANGQSAQVAAPFAGRITAVGCSVGATVSTAAATCTTSLNGSAISGGVFTVASATTAGPGGSTGVTGASCNDGDMISFAFSGTGTAGGPTSCWADVSRGQ